MQDAYSILGLSKGASKDTIRKAYRKLAFEYHPDKNPSPEAKQQFIRITEAYDALMEGKTFRAGRSSTVQKEPKVKSREELRREKMMRYYEARQAQFRKVRAFYNGPDRETHRRRFYGEVYFYYAAAGLLMVLSLAWPIATGKPKLVAIVFGLGVGVALRIIFYASRKKGVADMIFGQEEHYSFNELNSFFSAGNWEKI
jgi:hypothetical protein